MIAPEGRMPRLTRMSKLNEKGGVAKRVSFSPSRRKQTKRSLHRRRTRLRTARRQNNSPNCFAHILTPS